MYNLKIYGENEIYGQEWFVEDWFVLNLFLFDRIRLPQNMENIKSGDKITFYTKKEKEYFSIQLWEESNKNKIKVKNISDNSIITTYGMEINDQIVIDFSKRAFYSKSFGILFMFEILFFIILIPIALIHFSISIFALPKYIKNQKI